MEYPGAFLFVIVPLMVGRTKTAFPPLTTHNYLYFAICVVNNIYRSIRLFETGVLDAEETVKRLKTEVLQDQWTFHTEKMLSYIHFIDSKEIRTEEQ